jgi:anti-anti-sigma factor
VEPRLLELAAQSGARPIIVDASNLNFIQSLGFGALVAMHNQARAAGGRVIVAGLQSRVLKVLQLTRLDAVLEIAATREQAVRAAASSAAAGR